MSSSARFSDIEANKSTGPICVRPPIQQFVDWNNTQICKWITDVGFGQYISDVKRFVRSGRHLLNMTNQEYEKVRLIVTFYILLLFKFFRNCKLKFVYIKNV